MSIREFERLVNHNRSLAPWGREWFPRRLRQLAEFQGVADQSTPLTIAREPVIAFLRDHKDRGMPAWQRLQIVRAAQLYADSVLHAENDDLHDIRERLEVTADREQQSRAISTAPSDVIQAIDADEPPLLQKTRRQLRLQHYALRTETAYIGWIERFLKSHQLLNAESASELDDGDVQAFLTRLAVEGQVTSSTQNQALSALLFFFREVLSRELQLVDAVRARECWRCVRGWGGTGAAGLTWWRMVEC